MNTVLITGFKPFASHVINDSETCVKLLKDSGLDHELDVKLVTEVLDVCYTSALERVRKLWDEYKPFLVVHLGVHKADIIKIEKCARKCGYRHEDVQGSSPDFQVCPFGEEDIIYSKLDITDISRNCSRGNYIICHSENAGLSSSPSYGNEAISYVRTA